MRNLIITFFLVLQLSVTMAHDSLHLGPVSELSVRYHYNLLTWEVTRFPEKWLNWLGKALYPFSRGSQDNTQLLLDYFRLDQETVRAKNELDQAVAASSDRAPDLEQRLMELRRDLENLRPQAEEALEASITDVLRQEGVPLSAGPFIFPPVDIALDSLPRILVTSPRDRIELTDSILLTADISIAERQELEERIFAEEDVSALVDNIGGISTYPAIITANSLKGALVIASHEWLHNYMFFHPLGWNYNRDGQMSTLNETTADLFGQELGNLVYTRLTGEEPLQPPTGGAEPCPEDRFCFNQVMRQTRLQVDSLLDQGRIEEAEAYMEERRQIFVDNGYAIRKLNQAYFAFHGTYADSPASVSPIHQQLLDLREASPSLAAFIHSLQGVSSYDEFIALVQ